MIVWITLILTLFNTQQAPWPYEHNKLIIRNQTDIDFPSKGWCYVKDDTLFHTVIDISSPTGETTSKMKLVETNWIEYSNTLEFSARGYYVYPEPDSIRPYRVEVVWGFEGEAFYQKRMVKIREDTNIEFIFIQEN